MLPRFDVVRALLLMSATCVVPALFKLFLTKGHRGLASVVLDVIALAMQCSVFFIATIYLTREGVAIEDVAVLIQTTASLLLISLRYWGELHRSRHRRSVHPVGESEAAHGQVQDVHLREFMEDRLDIRLRVHSHTGYDSHGRHFSVARQ